MDINRDLFISEGLISYLQSTYQNIYSDKEIIKHFIRYKELLLKQETAKNYKSNDNDKLKIIFTDEDEEELEALNIYFYGNSDGSSSGSGDNLASVYVSTIETIKEMIKNSDDSIKDVVVNLTSLLDKEDVGDDAYKRYINELILPGILGTSGIISTTVDRNISDINVIKDELSKDEQKKFINKKEQEQREKDERETKLKIEEEEKKKKIIEKKREVIEEEKKLKDAKDIMQKELKAKNEKAITEENKKIFEAKFNKIKDEFNKKVLEIDTIMRNNIYEYPIYLLFTNDTINSKYEKFLYKENENIDDINFIRDNIKSNKNRKLLSLPLDEIDKNKEKIILKLNELSKELEIIDAKYEEITAKKLVETLSIHKKSNITSSDIEKIDLMTQNDYNKIYNKTDTKLLLKYYLKLLSYYANINKLNKLDYIKKNKLDENTITGGGYNKDKKKPEVLTIIYNSVQNKKDFIEDTYNIFNEKQDIISLYLKIYDLYIIPIKSKIDDLEKIFEKGTEKISDNNLNELLVLFEQFKKEYDAFMRKHKQLLIKIDDEKREIIKEKSKLDKTISKKEIKDKKDTDEIKKALREYLDGIANNITKKTQKEKKETEEEKEKLYDILELIDELDITLINTNDAKLKLELLNETLNNDSNDGNYDNKIQLAISMAKRTVDDISAELKSNTDNTVEQKKKFIFLKNASLIILYILQYKNELLKNTKIFSELIYNINIIKLTQKDKLNILQRKKSKKKSNLIEISKNSTTNDKIIDENIKEISIKIKKIEQKNRELKKRNTEITDEILKNKQFIEKILHNPKNTESEYREKNKTETTNAELKTEFKANEKEITENDEKNENNIKEIRKLNEELAKNKENDENEKKKKRIK